MPPHMQSRDSQYKEEVIAIDRVSRVQKGGRRFRFRALVTVGDGQGKVGLAVAKASDVASAIRKASAQAQKQMFKVALTDSGTIPHEVLIRFAGAKILLKPAGPGTGVIAGSTIRPILDAVGISDVLSKSLGSSNKLNNCYATMEALKSLELSPPRLTPKKSPKAKLKSKE